MNLKEYDQWQDGKAAVCNGKKWGYINSEGKLIIEYQFELVTGFSEGRAFVANSLESWECKWAIIDNTGNFITDYIFDDVKGKHNNEYKTHAIANKQTDTIDPGNIRNYP